jgi:hypothetical protein
MDRNSINVLLLLALGIILIACNGSLSTPISETAIPSPSPGLNSAVISSTADERVFYVAANEPGASDHNNGMFPAFQGEQNGPWLSITKAANTVKAGDIVYIRGGIYYESDIVFAHSGEPDAPITLANYQKEEVILDGSSSGGDSPGIRITEGQGYYVIQDLTIRNMGGSGIATAGDTSQPFPGINILDCILHDNGWSGIELAAVDRFVVENVEAYNNGFYGLNIISSDGGVISPANGIVQTSSFHHHIGEQGHGIAINQGRDILVRDSLAFHNTIHGFDISDWPKKGETSFNIILADNRSYDNGVAGFAINSDSHHVTFHHNIAYHNGADWAGEGSSSGFLCYEGCWHVEWYNNVSFENTDAGFFIEGEPGIYSVPEDYLLVFKNNIAYGNGRPEWGENFGLVVTGEQWQVAAVHNNWFGAPGKNTPVVGILSAGGQEEIFTSEDINRGAFQDGNISTDPLFRDLVIPDFSLQPGSPCIDAGVDVGLPYLGAAPDMGAFEFSGK